MKDIRIPTCMDCPSRLEFEERTGRILNGTRLQPFEKYCTATRRPKQIRKSGLLKKPPSWCPKLKDPCDLRVYGFVSEEEKQMHYFHISMFGENNTPMESRYALRYEGTIPHAAGVLAALQCAWRGLAASDRCGDARDRGDRRRTEARMLLLHAAGISAGTAVQARKNKKGAFVK